MPDYGNKDYWNNRYEEDEHPFDWLFDYQELAPILNKVLDDKTEEILLVGCGNAPFSPDMYDDGYTNLINTDLSDVCIRKQSVMYPNMKWEVMDVLDLPYKDMSLPIVIDKSLIDTLLCCKNSESQLMKMMTEIHRVMKPGGRFVSWSLHPIHEIEMKYLNKKFDWNVHFFRVKSKRWGPGKNCRRSVSHTMIICDKPMLLGSTSDKCRMSVSNLEFPGLILSEEEEQTLVKRAEELLLDTALKKVSLNSLCIQLYHVISSVEPTGGIGGDEKQFKRIEKLFYLWKKESEKKNAELENQAIDSNDDKD